MHPDRLSSTLPQEIPSQPEPVSDRFADLLAQFGDLDKACQEALDILLHALGRSSGLLLVQTVTDDAPILLAQQGLSEYWVAQTQNFSSRLFALARERITDSRSSQSTPESAPDFFVCDGEAPATLRPVIASTGVQALLLVEGKELSATEARLLDVLCPVLGRSLQTLRRAADQRQGLSQALLLQSELAELAIHSDFEGLETRLLETLPALLQCQAALLVLVDPDNPGWLVYKSLGGESKLSYHLQRDQAQGPVSECLHTLQAVQAEGPTAQIFFDPNCIGARLVQVESLLCAPLCVDRQPIGALVSVNKQGGSFNQADQGLLSSVARLAASAIAAGQMIQQLKIASADLEADRWELLPTRYILEALFNHLPASLYLIDPEYRLAVVSRSRAQRNGADPADLVGKICYQALFNRSRPCTECRVQETFQKGQVTQRNERRRSSPEDPSDWEIGSYPVLDGHGRVFQALLQEQDVTEKRRLEAILTQSEKLAAIGQLAAGVAHEINNPLTAIIANAQILHRELPSDSDMQESVDLIARAGARAAQVVRNLLDFARKEEVHLGLTDVNDTLERALELVQHELMARGVQVEFKADPNLPPLLASADHLQSVWLNLMLNAIDSLDKSPGLIRISAHKVAEDIQVQVEDNGKGIPPERLTRIFEPFYTTKAPGRGTGLGLSVSHRIIKQHGGQIRVESQVGIGSVFTVTIPAT